MVHIYASRNTEFASRVLSSEQRGLARELRAFEGRFGSDPLPPSQVSNMRFGARYQRGLLGAPRNLGGPGDDVVMNTPEKGSPAPDLPPERPTKRIGYSKAISKVKIPKYEHRPQVQYPLSGGPIRTTRSNRTARLQTGANRVVRYLGLHGGRPPNPLLQPYPHSTNMTYRAPPRVATRAYGGSSHLLGGGVGSFAPKRFAAAPTTVEVKFHDLADPEYTCPEITGGTMDHAASALDLCIITQGTKQGERVGADVHLKQLTLSYQPKSNGASGTAADWGHWRMTIFLWKPATDAVCFPTWNDIFISHTANSDGVTPDSKSRALDTAFGMYNTTTASNYRILSDKTGTLSGQIAVPLIGASIAPMVKIAVPLNVTCKYTGELPSAPGDGAFGSNKIWMLFSAINQNTIVDIPVTSFSVRVWYTDN